MQSAPEITPRSEAEDSSPSPVHTNAEMALRLWAYLRPYKVRLAAGLMCGVIAGLLPIKTADLLKKFIMTLAPGHTQQTRGLTLVCAGVVVIYALLGTFRYLQSVLLAEVTQRVGVAMRQDVYAHLQSMSLAYFHRRRTGALMSTLTNDVSRLQDAAMRIRDVVATPIQAIGYLVYMLSLNWRLTLFSLFVLPFMALSIQVLTRKLRGISTESQERAADVVSVMEETLAAPRIVRAFSAEKRELARFQGANLRALAVQLRSARRNATLGPTVDLIGATGIALTLWYGGSEVLKGTEHVGDLVAFVLMVSLMAGSIGSLGALRGSWEEMMGAADRLFSEVLDVKPDITDAPDALELPVADGRISFENVSFSYEVGKPTLQHIDLQIEPGQVVALVGQTGAGKSTLADLVPRFYDPNEGAVRIDGYDLRDLTVASLRRQIAIVPQETLLFSGSIRDNIAYGRPDATEAQVEAAATAANADSFIQSLPAKYETLIGERGQTLSGGERQRIAIARALLADPRILILDEATSSLDASTESLVQEALDVLMRGRTTIVIAHRLSTIVNADRIVVMRTGGRIAESGTHTELMKAGGVYAALYESQRRAAELTAIEP
jgi:subfamily B ATP-binding cassette protein MsbA